MTLPPFGSGPYNPYLNEELLSSKPVVIMNNERNFSLGYEIFWTKAIHGRGNPWRPSERTYRRLRSSRMKELQEVIDKRRKESLGV
jgi:hypothetical protein